MTLRETDESMEAGQPVPNIESYIDPEKEDYNDKLRIECICPKCGKTHLMALHWIGRGIPRKFCSNCKGRVGDD